MLTCVLRRDTGSNTSQLHLFIDGVEDTSAALGGYPNSNGFTNIDTLAWNGTSTWDNYGTLYDHKGVEMYWGSSMDYGPSMLDNISTWNHGMTNAEVTELWNSGSPDDLSVHSKVANLSNWWDMNQTPGDTTGTINRAPSNSAKGYGVIHFMSYISGTGHIIDYGSCDYDTSNLP